MDGMFHWTVLEQNVFTEVKMRIFHILLFWASSSMAAVPVPVILVIMIEIFLQAKWEIKVILDTDMDFDVDDVGALCVLHALQVGGTCS